MCVDVQPSNLIADIFTNKCDLRTRDLMPSMSGPLRGTYFRPHTGLTLACVACDFWDALWSSEFWWGFCVISNLQCSSHAVNALGLGGIIIRFP